MVARVMGDVYELPALGEARFFMQHVADDSSQLGSNVVQVFHGTSAHSEEALSKLSTLEPHFFVHVFLQAGEALEVWRKVGRSSLPPISLPLWCACAASDMRLARSDRWRVWRTGNEPESVGGTSPLLRSAEIGLAMSPLLVVERAHTGSWSFVYPNFRSW